MKNSELLLQCNATALTPMRFVEMQNILTLRGDVLTHDLIST
jgi:hypothetical protein